MNVRQAASLMGASTASLSAELFDKEIKDFSIDSRSVGAGELFFALSQEDYARAGFNGTFADAHRFIPQAFSGGAIAAVARADRARDDEHLQAMKDRLLLVEDAIAALQTCWHHRQRRQNDCERTDGARVEQCWMASVEKPEELQQQPRSAVGCFANGQRGKITPRVRHRRAGDGHVVADTRD